jgi:hypothetical protein
MVSGHKKTFFGIVGWLAISIIALITGCRPAPVPYARIPIATWTSVRDIFADDNGLWAAVDESAPYVKGGRLSPKKCSVCRYGLDGVLQREVVFGEGLCRQLKYFPDGFLVLVVSMDEDGVVLWTSDKAGEKWTSLGTLPCNALAAARLRDGVILIWSENRVFKSSDEGKTWCQLPVNLPRGVEQGLMRESLIEERANGDLLLALRVYEGGSSSTIRVGVYSEKENFRQLHSISGTCQGISTQQDGAVVVLAHEDSGDDPVQVIYCLRELSTKKLSQQVVCRTKSTLPRELIAVGNKVFAFSTIWKTPGSFLDTFDRRILSFWSGWVMVRGLFKS